MSATMTKLSRKLDSDERKFFGIKKRAADGVCSTRNNKNDDFIKKLS